MIIKEKLLLQDIYKRGELSYQKERYEKLSVMFKQAFNHSPEKYFSSPGRTELSGNHTDHNHGKVLAASINLDSIAAASANDKNEVVLFSEGYSEPFKVNLENLEPVQEEKNTTASLIRGVASGLKNNGYDIKGFNAVITSDVLIGSGLSSSASIEVLIGTIFNHLFNDGQISSTEIAITGQFAENNFFGKPCGLMDQLACATGGIIKIDFSDPAKPEIQQVNFDFDSTGYKLLVVDTEANHSDLTEDYASVPNEMKAVADYFIKNFCSEISMDDLLSEIKSLRKKVGDRAVLRAIHFLQENKRVEKQSNALLDNKFDEFLSLVNESGNSSYKYLQNIYSHHNIKEQSVSLALALTEKFIKENEKGACRIHGGGFAGTILVFLPEDLVNAYKKFISNLFSEESVKVLSIRKFGASSLNNIS
jgi:galactokinase